MYVACSLIFYYFICLIFAPHWCYSVLIVRMHAQEEGILVDIEKAKREASELYQAGEKKFWWVSVFWRELYHNDSLSSIQSLVFTLILIALRFDYFMLVCWALC